MSSYRETLLQSIYNKVKSTEDCAVKPPTKSNKLSDKLRSQGNKFFSDGLFLNAIDEYNKSLCFAELTGDQFNLSVAYANRADALFRMDLPRDCLKSIELAKAANYPEHLEQRLTLMAARCQEKIKFTLQPRPKYRLQLSHPANERIPFVAKNLRLKESEEFGRHIVTTQDLNVGDVIMIERPFVVCLRPGRRYKRCSHCTNNERFTLIPCKSCTNAMYCSDRCLEEAHLVYHRFECGISENLLHFDEFSALALRCLLVGLSVFETWDKFQEFINEQRTTKLNAFDVDYTREEAAERRKWQFLVLDQMHFADSHLSTEDRQHWMRQSAELTSLLKQALKLTEQQESFVLNTLYRYTVTGILNSYEKESTTVSQHLTLSLLNHSCAPNVQRLMQGGHQVVMVVRPIQRGAQLFDNYGSVYTQTPRKERQEQLLAQYGFRCVCEGCVEEYPVARKLKWKKGLEGEEGVKNSLAELMRQSNPSLEAKLNRADKLCKFLEQHDRLFPCKQLHAADSELYGIYSTLIDEVQWEEQFKQFYRHKK